MIVEVNYNGQFERIDLFKSINELLDKVEDIENRHLTNDEMRNISSEYINMIKPYIVKVIN
jgi:hypothetical protein